MFIAKLCSQKEKKIVHLRDLVNNKLTGIFSAFQWVLVPKSFGGKMHKI